MNGKIRVLIFPAGEINAIELHDALCSNVNIEVIGASSFDRHGPYVFKKYISGLPLISDPKFIEEFNKVLDEEKIDIIFPTHDSVVLFFAENSSLFNAKVLTADVNTAHICRDKRDSYKLFCEESFCPKVYKSFDDAVYPCFVKPRDAQGAVGARIIEKEDAIPEGINWEDYVITEYLPGTELTVDCLTDAQRTLKAVLPRSRDRILSGVSVAGTALQATGEVLYIANKINEKLKFLGLWYFQIKRDIHEQYKLLEISARCAGTMCLSRARGINLPLLSVYVAMGRTIEVFENSCPVRVDRAMISRYHIDYVYDDVYIDYDDTIIIQNEVCLPVIRFLYQCRNAGKRLVLLTRHQIYHSDSLRNNMKKFCIPQTLFDKIVELGQEEEKYTYIEKENSIFIDNAYIERKKVYERLNIPVFDVEGIEVLTDWTS